MALNVQSNSSALDITKPTFGAKKTAATDRPKAQLWLNIGYPVEVELADGSKETRFISLPMGLPLDTMEEVPTNSSNAVFANMQAAKNNLFRQLMEAGSALPEGGERLVNLQIQLRRVNGETKVVDNDSNPFIQPLAL